MGEHVSQLVDREVVDPVHHWTSAELAETLAVPLRWVRDHALQLGGTKLGGTWRFPMGELSARLRYVQHHQPAWWRKVWVRCPECGGCSQLSSELTRDPYRGTPHRYEDQPHLWCGEGLNGKGR